MKYNMNVFFRCVKLPSDILIKILLVKTCQEVFKNVKK